MAAKMSLGVLAGVLLWAGQASAQTRGNQPPNRLPQGPQQNALKMTLPSQNRLPQNLLQQTGLPTFPGGQGGPTQQRGSQQCPSPQGQNTSTGQGLPQQIPLQQSQGGTQQSNSRQARLLTGLQQRQATLQSALQQTNDAITTLQQLQSQISPQQYSTLLTALQQRQSDLQSALQQTTDALTAQQQSNGRQTTY